MRIRVNRIYTVRFCKVYSVCRSFHFILLYIFLMNHAPIYIHIMINRLGSCGSKGWWHHDHFLEDNIKTVSCIGSTVVLNLKIDHSTVTHVQWSDFVEIMVFKISLLTALLQAFRYKYKPVITNGRTG